jgi:hypothetical protein
MANKIDLSKFTAAELDTLIVEVAKHRANMQPAPAAEHPKKAEAIINPAWYTGPVDVGTLFQIRHPGLGWLSFIIPHAERAHLLAVWLHQALTFGNNSPPAEIASITGTGGKLH